MAGQPERDKERMRKQQEWEKANVRGDLSLMAKRLKHTDWWDKDAAEEHF